MSTLLLACKAERPKLTPLTCRDTIDNNEKSEQCQHSDWHCSAVVKGMRSNLTSALTALIMSQCVHRPVAAQNKTENTQADCRLL